MLHKEAIPAWPFAIMKSHPWLWKLRKSCIVPPVGVLSKIFFEYLSRSQVFNREALLELVGNRADGQGLVTVSNHYSCLDEPVLNGMLNWRHLLSPDVMRWSPAAHDICFTRPFHCWFFTSGKCVPIVRGEGVYQRAMNFLVERLRRGDWVHLFPEGRVNTEHEHLRLKWGVGRLVAEPERTPTVLPYWHLGMDAALPNRPPYVPRPGQTITVLVGRPLTLAAEVARLRRRGASSREARRTVTERVQDELERLRSRAEQLHAARLAS
ncbi:tafazzin-like isoform X2 [Amphibalanus amphitrite]|uniref:tafazzin-like isoform X1 n=3 Tax=Amphibalanus amphitrite TaxID=1232801 RepID=UPI001C9013ED|nr:tafazzin-like isoform X1 [Amphibalanus amphitrite]XP_043216722.1 tafazzin-like isoform X2 [Amphibalanus amphitrite]